MTIQDYERLTGITVATGDVKRIEAIIRRCESKLGSLLGYSLRPPKSWTELGKLQLDGLVPFPSLPVDDEVLNDLQPADDQTGEIYLFNVDELDTHIRIRPAREVYSAKIVLPVNESEFITIQRLYDGTPYLNSAGLVTAITRDPTWFSWTWWNSLLWSHKASLMLAVDANWAKPCSPEFEELMYLLTDMVAYYSDPSYSLMGNIRSESIDSHSYSRASTGSTPDKAAPEGREYAQALIDKFASGSRFRKLVR